MNLYEACARSTDLVVNYNGSGEGDALQYLNINLSYMGESVQAMANMAIVLDLVARDWGLDLINLLQEAREAREEDEEEEEEEEDEGERKSLGTIVAEMLREGE